MALKDLVIDRHERRAMEIVAPFAHELWPMSVDSLTADIAQSLRAAAASRDDASHRCEHRKSLCVICGRPDHDGCA